MKASSDVIEKSWCGNWREEHLFTLGQSRQFYRFYQEQIVICETNIERLRQEFAPRVDPQQTPLPPDNQCNRSGAKRRKKAGHVESQFDLRTEAYKLFGVDVTQIPGLETNLLPLFSEVGRDLSRWPRANHFIYWLSLCPDNEISGGRVLCRGMRKTNKRPGQIFRRAVLTSQSHAHRRIPTASPSQARPRRRHHRHRPQDRHPVSTASSPAKSNSTALSRTPPTLSVNDESKLDSPGKLVDSATNSFFGSHFRHVTSLHTAPTKRASSKVDSAQKSNRVELRMSKAIAVIAGSPYLSPTGLSDKSLPVKHGAGTLFGPYKPVHSEERAISR